jgi:ketosteroid isomerase-like protein
MSQENVRIIRDAALAFQRGRLDAWLDYWADDVDYRAAEGAVDDRGPLHGKAALRAYVQDWLDGFDNFKNEPVEILEAGEDKVVAVHRVSGTAKQSGVETEMSYAAVYTIRDGKVIRAREYLARDQALEAAGLSE